MSEAWSEVLREPDEPSRRPLLAAERGELFRFFSPAIGASLARRREMGAQDEV
ncbi:MAG TPA: hypothetical protein PK535_03610 [Synergistaceae bacterium]|nr:hypothetical protein [Synergistaceae bacterium]